jgi:hypothetical protein
LVANLKALFQISPSIHRVTAMTTSRLLQQVAPVSVGQCLYKQALKRFEGRFPAQLTGPDAQPVFVPAIDPYGQNYRGLVLMPPGVPKKAPKA